MSCAKSSVQIGASRRKVLDQSRCQDVRWRVTWKGDDAPDREMFVLLNPRELATEQIQGARRGGRRMIGDEMD